MIIDGRGSILVGASVTLAKGDKVFNTRFVGCDIDDLDADSAWAENCRFDDCKLRRHWEAEQRLAKT